MFAPLKTLSIATLVVTSLVAGSASAETFLSNGRTFEVRFSDLDLSRAEDQKELQARINRAASKVCTSGNVVEITRCRSAAIAHVRVPVTAAIARAETKARYAEAGKGPHSAITN